MIIDKINTLTVLHAEGINKITNTDRSFFSDIIYLGKNDSVENYEEVTEDVWKHYIGEYINEDDSKVLKKQITDLQIANDELGELLLETDYRLLQIQIYGLEEI